MGGRGSGGGLSGNVSAGSDITGYDDVNNPEDRDAQPPYVSSKPPTFPPGQDLTRAEKSWIEAFYDGLVGLTTDAIETVVNA